MAKKISEILYTNIKRKTEHCPKCNQEFLYEQSFDVNKSIVEIKTELLNRIRSKGYRVFHNEYGDDIEYIETFKVNQIIKEIE